MVELVVVIGIIVLLIGILMPVIVGVRKRGYDARSRSLMSKISAAAHAYYGDWHAYPGIFSDADILPAGKQKGPPQIPLRGGGGITLNGATSIDASQNLVLSLLGGLWTDWQSRFQYDATIVGKGAASLNAGEVKTYPAYMDAAPGELWDVKVPVPDSGTMLSIPVFADGWPTPKPILYFRARVGGKYIADDTTGTPSGGIDAQYLSNQNAELGLSFPPDTTKNPNAAASGTIYFRSPTLSPNAVGTNVVGSPRGKDAFLLIYSGLDRLWGTPDDSFGAE